jgi:hypothetical protein
VRLRRPMVSYCYEPIRVFAFISCCPWLWTVLDSQGLHPLRTHGQQSPAVSIIVAGKGCKFWTTTAPTLTRTSGNFFTLSYHWHKSNEEIHNIVQPAMIIKNINSSQSQLLATACLNSRTFLCMVGSLYKTFANGDGRSMIFDAYWLYI